MIPKGFKQASPQILEDMLTRELEVREQTTATEKRRAEATAKTSVALGVRPEEMTGEQKAFAEAMHDRLGGEGTYDKRPGFSISTQDRWTEITEWEFQGVLCRAHVSPRWADKGSFVAFNVKSTDGFFRVGGETLEEAQRALMELIAIARPVSKETSG